MMELKTTPNISKKKCSISPSVQIRKNEKTVTIANGMPSEISAVFNFELEKKDDEDLVNTLSSLNLLPQCSLIANTLIISKKYENSCLSKIYEQFNLV